MKFRSLGLLVSLFCALAPAAREAIAADAARPNILWITLEDISPHVGCYGDKYARTPNMDALAARGVRYTNAFATIGVCAPSRSTMITGVYAPALGTHHMRCQGDLPEGVPCFPQYLREAGYYCTNNVKTDYNFKPPREAWDESSKDAHYKNRAKDQPFFAVFNLTTCHESQIRLGEAEYQRRMSTLDPADKHDPAKAELPPYHPDTPEVRKDWARYADAITFTDRRIGELLQELEEAGLADDTIVFVFSDHGAGMPRSKRWLYDTSLKVPFIVHVPEKYKDLAPAKAGGTVDQMISLIDVGPTILSLVGIEPPKHMQGSAFLGKYAGPPRKFIYGFRDRMDERTDMIRAVRDDRFKYIRNYYPQRPYFHEQWLSYANQMPTLRVWQDLSKAGKLSGPQAIFMGPDKPTEELYDTQADPFEINNLAGSPEHRETLDRLRKELDRWQAEIIDLGLLAEADLRTRFDGRPAYNAVREKPASYPLAEIAEAASVAIQRDPKNLPQLTKWLSHSDPAVRFWAAQGLVSLKGASPEEAKEARKAAQIALQDSASWVRASGAEALCVHGDVAAGQAALETALSDANPWVRLYAIETIARLGLKGESLERKLDAAHDDANDYVIRVAEHVAPKPAGERPNNNAKKAKGKKAKA